MSFDKEDPNAVLGNEPSADHVHVKVWLVLIVITDIIKI